jgi:hypothetical protein
MTLKVYAFAEAASGPKMLLNIFFNNSHKEMNSPDFGSALLAQNCINKPLPVLNYVTL